MKQNTRKHKKNSIEEDSLSIQQQAEDIIGKGPKWLVHQSSIPQSQHIGKPLEGKEAGRSRPTYIHETIDLVPSCCWDCRESIKDPSKLSSYDAIGTDLVRELDEVGCYE